MGEKLQKIFKYVEDQGGEIAVLRTIVNSGISKEKAAILPDTKENIEKLEAVARKILNRVNLNYD